MMMQVQQKIYKQQHQQHAQRHQRQQTQQEQYRRDLLPMLQQQLQAQAATDCCLQTGACCCSYRVPSHQASRLYVGSRRCLGRLL